MGKVNSCLLLIIIFLFSYEIHYSLSASVRKPDVTYQIRKQRLLGLDLTLAIFDILVEEDLFINEAFECTPDCKELPTDCSTCDYSKPNNCGVPSTNFDTNVTSTCEECPYSEYFCDKEKRADNTFEELVVDQESEPYVTDIEFVFYRFQFLSPCHGIHLKAKQIYGSVSFIITTYSNLQETFSSTSAEPNVVICPKDFHYRFGTIFIVLFPRRQSSKGTVLITTKDFGNKTTTIEPPKKCSDSSPYYCVDENTTSGMYSAKRLEFIFFRITIETCKQFLLRREILSTSTNDMGDLGIVFQTGSPGASPNLFHINSPINFVFGICPENEKEPSYLYLTFVNLEVAFDFLFTLSSDKSQFHQQKISKYKLFEGLSRFTGTMDLVCGKQTFSCRRGADYWGTSCLEFWVGASTEETTALWPRPLFLLNRDPETFSNLPVEKEKPMLSDRMTAGFLLEMVAGSDVVEPFSQWKTNFSQSCLIHFPLYSAVTNSQGIPIFGDFKFQVKENECSYENFLEVSSNIDQLIDEMSLQTDSSSILGSRYMIDVTTFTPTWQGCQSNIQSHLKSQSVEQTFLNTKECPLELFQNTSHRSTDPCCNQTLGWTQCCIERDIQVNGNRFVVKDTGDSGMCGDSDCLTNLLNDYIFYQELGDSLTGCSTAVQETLSLKKFKSLRFMDKCKQTIFGPDGYGKECGQDSECLSGVCDVKQNLCVFQTEHQIENIYQSFFECIDEEMTSNVKEYLVSRNSVELTSSFTFVDFLSETYREDECVESFGRSLSSGGYIMDPYASDACLKCDFYCFDQSCTPPLRCEANKPYGRPNNICPFGNVWKNKNQGRCNEESNFVCNWNQTINTQSDCESEEGFPSQSFCGVCDSPTSCILTQIETQEECVGNVCVVGGQVLEHIQTEEECKKAGMCSIDCENCGSDKDICESNGYCTDQRLVDFVFEATNLTLYEGTKVDEGGLCISPMSAWNDPDCAQLPTETANIPTAIGCVKIMSKSNCTKNGLSWIEVSKNKEQCEKAQQCTEPSIPTSLTTPKNEKQCSECEGETSSVFEWVQGKWESGRLRTVSWRERKWEQKTRWGDTIDFLELSNQILDSNTEPYSFELQTEAQCRLNPLKTVMKKILCFCEVGENREEICFGDETNLLIGVGKACPNQDYTLVAPPSVIQFHSTTSTFEQCTELSVSSLLASEIRSSTPSSISTSFRKEKKSSDNVKNSKGAFVGELLGNGISISMSFQTNVSFTLCILIETDHSSSSSSSSSSSKTIYDFGRRISMEEVQPLSLEVSLSIDGKLCSTIDVELLKQQYQTDKEIEEFTFYPISLYSENWSEQNKEEGLSDSEVGVYVVMFVLYIILLSYKIVDEILSGKKITVPKRWISFLLMGCLFVRIVYFGMLIGDDISDGDSLGEFLLIEIPSYLYFLAIVLAALIWHGVGTIQSVGELGKIVFKKFLLCAFLTILFLLLIVVWWQSSSESGEYSCGGRVYDSGESTTQEALRLSYRIILSGASILVAAAVSYYGQSVYNTLRKSQAHQSGNQKFQTKVYQVTVVSSISLVCQCLFFILYSELATPSYYYVFVLLGVEWFPTVIIFVLLSTAKSPKLSRSSTSGNSNSGMFHSERKDPKEIKNSQHSTEDF